MRSLPFLLLLLAPWAAAQTQGAKPQEPQQAPAQAPATTPARPLILRIDQLPPSERSVGVQEAPPQKAGDGLPELGGKPSPLITRNPVTGSGTGSQGSPYPLDSQVGSGK
jgi:hypothetical protein